MARPIAGLMLTAAETTHLGELTVPITEVETVEESITLHVKGTVVSINNEYFTHLIYNNLTVKIYEVKFNAEPILITTTNVKANGTFSKNVATAAAVIVVKLFIAEDGGELLADESSKLSRHNSIDITFNVNESTLGNTIFSKIKARLNSVGIAADSEPAVVAALTDANISELEPLTCINSKTLNRFRLAYKYWNSFFADGLSFPEEYLTLYEDGRNNALAFKEDPSEIVAAERGRKLFFALLKNKIGASIDEIFTYSRTQFELAISASADANEIDAGLNIGDNLTYLEDVRNMYLFNSNDDGRYYDAKLIHLLTSEYEEKNELLNDAIESGGLASVNDREAAKITLLNKHLHSHLPFLKTVVDMGGYDLNYFNIAASGPNELGALITEPSHLPDGFDTYADYADSIYKSIGDSEPSGRLAFNLESSAFPSATEIRDAIIANPEFNINEHSAEVFFTITEGHPNSIDEIVMENLLALQRTLRLTGDSTNLTLTETLTDLSLTSATSIMNLGRESFMRLVTSEPANMSNNDAHHVWCHAQATHNAASLLAWQFLGQESEGSLVPSGLRSPLSTNIPDVEHLPNMTTLFGNLNNCHCEHCQSVYSPAAYLTDLLNWLRKDVIFPTTPYASGLDALEISGTEHRRKDIRHINLNCENTNTLIPYIDIVNEILSVNVLKYTANFPLPIPGNSSPTTEERLEYDYKILQTRKTSEEVMAEPENRFTASEDLLKNYYYPWVLPYNVANEEVLTFTRASGIEYHDVVTAFSPVTPDLKYNTDHWAKAFLGINDQEFTLLTSAPSGSFWADYWGLASAPNVGQVLNSAKLTIDELKDILTAYYIQHSGSKIEINPVSDLCDVDSYTFIPGFGTTAGELFMKFVRLKTRTDLSTWELDTAIETMSPGSGITTAFLQKLASSISFSKDYNIPFSEILVMQGDEAYNDLYTPTNFTQYYKDKFLNPLFHPDVRNFFDSAPYPVDVDDLTYKEKQYLSNVLEISIPAVDAIINYLNLSGSFTSAVLAQIHRYSILLRTFDIPPEELGDHVIFFGDIFAASNKMKKAYEFADSLNRFRQMSLTLSEVRDIVEGSNDFSITGLDSAAEKSWSTLEEVFQQARKENPDIDATQGTNLNFYKNILVRDLSNQFFLRLTEVETLITTHSANWFSDFIDDPDGGTTTRDWVNKSTDFAPVHQLLHRVSFLSSHFNFPKIEENDLERRSLVYGIETQIPSTSMSVPVTAPFFWLEDDFTSLTLTKLNGLIWLWHTTHLAALLDMPQRDFVNSPPVDFYLVIDDYLANSASYSTGPSYQPIVNLYNSLGENSTYKELSVYEFTEIFLRAKAIAPTSTDLVSVMETFETIHNVLNRFSIKVADAWGWIWSTWSAGTFTATSTSYAMSADIKRALATKKYTNWNSFIVPFQNELREKMRDAFVALYIGYMNFQDENTLYAHYLLDTQMSSCMKTSRIVSAISSVQLLVHRALLNLESGVHMDDTDIQEWQWRKNYRVWEASRKVFLYPENWIDPSLRANKTELFKEAEDFLLQDEINDKNCEQAFAGYLTGLNDIAQLDMRAIYVEDPQANLEAGHGMIYRNNPDEIYHVFARTWNPPYIYYYRKFSQGAWTGWEKIDVEIDSDHLIPVMFNQRIYLFFPLFTERIYGNLDYLRYYEIQMCYTKLDYGKWSPKKVLPKKIVAGPRAFTSMASENLWERVHPNWHDYATNPKMPNNVYPDWNKWSYASMQKSDFYFWAHNTAAGGLNIHCRRALDPNKRQTSGTYTEFCFEVDFKISRADERVIIEDSFLQLNAAGIHFLARPYMTMPYFQQIKHGKALFLKDQFGNFPEPNAPGENKMFVKTAVTHGNSSIALLGQSSGYLLTYPHQYAHSIIGQPFFYKDGSRSYFFRFKPVAIQNFPSGTH